MGLLGRNRGDGGPDPHLDKKIAIFFTGGAVGVAGMVTDSTWLIVIAIVILALGFLLRFLPREE